VRYIWIAIPAFMILMTTQIAAHVQQQIFGFPFTFVWVAFWVVTIPIFFAAADRRGRQF
jgi:hypothetical protein